MGGFAWVTLATNDSYSLGALVLAHSLRRVGTKYDLAVLVTPGVTGAMREKLSSVFSLVQEVNVLDSKDEANLALLARPELGITFTKLHCWRLTQYEKCVFVDADTLVIRNCDELFEREELSAAPDVGWPDCFNSGVFVFKPSQQTFASITAFAAAKGSFDGGDQGLLNQYFSDWSHKDISKHLPFIYNMCSTATYSYLPAFKQFGDDVRIIHFIGITKPWLQYFDTITGQVQPAPGSHHLQPLLQLWWNIFCENVHPQLSPVMASSTLASVWHELNPIPTVNSYPRIFHQDVDKFTCEDVQTVPDFSEFQDPWDTYKKSAGSHDYYSHIKQNESRNTSNRNEVCTQHSHSEQFTSEIHCVNSEINDEYKESSVLVNRENSERQNSQTYHESSTNFHQNNSQEKNFYHQNNSQEKIFHHQNNSQEKNFQTHNPSQTITTIHEHFYRHESQTNYNQESEYRHNDENNCNHEKDYHSEEKNEQNFHSEQKNEQNYHSEEKNEQNYHMEDSHKNEQNNWIECKHNSFENNHQHRDDDSHRKTDDTRNDSHGSMHVFTIHDRETTEITRSCIFNDENKRSTINDQDRLQDQSNIDRDEKHTDEFENKSQSPSQPCTKSKCITTQSEPNIAGQLESNDAGIAGALAKITLGEARSPEQVAFEEHMRKQSWEQGQIDYMGRDSFDNIWKKISETLAVQQPQRQPSPPKTVAKPDKKSEIEAAPAVGTTEDAPAAKSEAAVLPELRQREEQDLISELAPALAKVISPQTGLITEVASEHKVPSQSSSTDVAVTTVALTPSAVPEKFPLETVKSSPSPKNDNSTLTAVQTSTTDSSEEPKKTEKILQSEKEVKLEASTEILSDSPVPIQVAESVLEAEVKESLTEDLRPVTEEAISSIPVSAQESVPAVLETAMEAVDPPTSTPNGSAALRPEIGNGIDALNLSSLPSVLSPASAVVEITPEVVTSLQSPEIPAAQIEGTSALPARPVESIPAAPLEQKEETCSLPVRQVESLSDVASGEKKEETCPLPVKQIESLSDVATGEKKEETCSLPIKQIESLSDVATGEKKEETCSLPIKQIESLSDVATVERKEETCALPVKQIESLSDVVTVEKKEETCPLPAKQIESLSDVATVEKKEETCALPAKLIESLSDVATVEKKEETCALPAKQIESLSDVATVEKKEETCPLPVKETKILTESEKSQEVKLQEEIAAELSLLKQIKCPKREESRELVILIKKEESSSLPVKETKISTESEKSQEVKIPAEKACALPAETPEKLQEPIKCPMKKRSEEIVSIKTEESSSLPVAEPIVGSSIEIEQSIEKKVPKNETKDVEIVSEETPSQSESSEESPIRPARTKDIQIPGTPIVTEATPPTSPPIGAVESFQDQPTTKVTKKVVKKVVKKTSGETKQTEGTDADAAEGKKVTKKIVKKVVKKTKEDDPSAPESSSGIEKPKKIVKVVKKTTKTSQTLEADTTVPETPPPGTSEVPVPPKRKVKTTAKTTPAKTDSEP